jgi:hypothetical protein
VTRAKSSQTFVIARCILSLRLSDIIKKFHLKLLVQMKGEAEAFAIEAKAKAEAEQMARKAAAWKQYEDAAVVDMILNMLPKVFLRRVASFYNYRSC